MARQNHSSSHSSDNRSNESLVLLLINLYQVQLIRGCGSPQCKTPSCYTYRKHHSSKPLRRLSSVSARATAFYLADGENPEAHLCPFVVRHTLGPRVEANHQSNKPLDDLVRFTTHLTSLSSSDHESSSSNRQDPCSFAQKLFSTAITRQRIDGSLTEDAQDGSSASSTSVSEKDHDTLIQAGNQLQEILLQFDRDKDTEPVVNAFCHALTSLLASHESIKQTFGYYAYVSPLYPWEQFRFSFSNPDPVTFRLATVVVVSLASLRNSIPKSHSSSYASFAQHLKCVTPTGTEEHLLSLLLYSISKIVVELGSSSMIQFRWWIQSMFLNFWDKNPIIDSGSLPAAAILFIEFLRGLADEPDTLTNGFQLTIRDPYQAALQRSKIGGPDKTDSINLLNYPWMLSKNSQITCFRAILLHRMSDAVGEAFLNMRILSSAASGLFHGPQRSDEPQRPPPEVLSLQFGQLQIATSRHLTLQVDRDRIVDDAFTGIWRRQERELFRPLKVKMTNAGELGVDQGGLAQEFFRLVFIEIFDPSFAAFSIEERTRMAWFDPKSLEPLYKFEMLGTLMALAIFNGFTLAVNFPLCLYRKLCNVPVKTLTHIEDGWPDLVKGLRQLLDWEDGDVSDTFCRSYVFTFEAFGQKVHVDMTKVDAEWSPTAAMANNQNDEENAPLVTNATRENYVADYIEWLTYKSVAPQFDAFARGFHRILDHNTLRTIEPSVLRDITEGYRIINTKELQRVTRYDAGYCSHRPYIRDFWEIVHSFDEVKKKQLLEFVTASDRIPVTGISTIDFVVQRHGGDTESLPTSVTCFGRLLLPQYENREKLRTKLELALENSTGFGLS